MHFQIPDRFDDSQSSSKTLRYEYRYPKTWVSKSRRAQWEWIPKVSYTEKHTYKKLFERPVINFTHKHFHSKDQGQYGSKTNPSGQTKWNLQHPTTDSFPSQVRRNLRRIYNGNQPRRSPVTGSIFSPSVTYAARRCSTNCVKPLTPHRTARSLCLLSHECLNAIVHTIRHIPYKGLNAGRKKWDVTPKTASGTSERK